MKALVTFLALVLTVSTQLQAGERLEIEQIKYDEGYRSCKYIDILGYEHIGYGHLLREGEYLPKCISKRVAVTLLQKDYDKVTDSVAYSYPWAKGVPRLILINMTFQMGSVGRFTKFLDAIKKGNYKLAAKEMLDSKWARQTPKRAQRLVDRVMQIKE